MPAPFHPLNTSTAELARLARRKDQLQDDAVWQAELDGLRAEVDRHAAMDAARALAGSAQAPAKAA